MTELERVQGLIQDVETAEAALRNYQPLKLQPLELQQGTGGNMLVSMTPEEYALQRTMHAAQTRIEKLGLDTARKYADALGEIERLREALKACASELAGGGMTKRGLTDALELARAALAPEESDE